MPFLKKYIFPYFLLISVGSLKYNFLEKLGIKDLEQCAVLIIPSLELEQEPQLQVSRIILLLGCDTETFQSPTQLVFYLIRSFSKYLYRRLFAAKEGGKSVVVF